MNNKLKTFILCLLSGLLGIVVGLNIDRSIRQKAQTNVVTVASSLGTGSDISQFPVNETFELPSGQVTIQSTFKSVFPEFEGSHWYKQLAKEKRSAIVTRRKYDRSSTSAWPTQRMAQDDNFGPFHIATVVVGAIQRYFDALENVPLPKEFVLPTTMSRPLTIKVYKSIIDLEQSSPTWAENVGKNGYYDSENNTIGIFVDSEILGYLFPESELDKNNYQRAAESWDAIRRTFVLPLYHELTHAFQQSVALPRYRAPFIAEGQAAFITTLLEREETLYPLIHTQQDIDTMMTKSKVRNGEYLVPSEYLRLARLRGSFSSKSGEALAEALQASPQTFLERSKAEENYDLAWFVFYYFSKSREKGDAASLMVDVAERLSAASRIQELGDLEQRLHLFLNTELPRTKKDAVIHMLAPAILQFDQLRLQGKYFDGYRAFVPVLRADPNRVALLSYIGDIFLNSGQRDLFFHYYDQAMQREGLRGAETLSGRIRIINRYAGAFITIGNYERAKTILSDFHVSNELDISSLYDMNLRSRLLYMAKEANWDAIKMRRLMKEYRLGQAIQILKDSLSEPLFREGLQSSSTSGISPVQLAEGITTIFTIYIPEIQRLMRELGYQEIPSSSWFLLDFQVSKKHIDLDQLMQQLQPFVTVLKDRNPSLPCYFRESAEYNPVQCNEALMLAFERIGLFISGILHDDRQVIQQYMAAVRVDPVLLSGQQIKWAINVLRRSDEEDRLIAYMLLGLSGDKLSLEVLKMIPLAPRNDAEKKVQEWAIGFLQRQGRDLSYKGIPATHHANGLRAADLLAFPLGAEQAVNDEILRSAKMNNRIRIIARKNNEVNPRSFANLAFLTSVGGVDPSTLHLALAEFYSDNRNYRIALAYGNAALKLSPTSHQIENTLGNILDASGDPKAAIEHYQKSIDKGRQDGWPECNMGSTYAKLGLIDSAEEWFNKAIARRMKTADDTARQYNQYAWFLVTSRSDNRAKLENAVKMSLLANQLTNYENGNFLDTLAACMFATGNKDKAIAIQKRALQLLPEDDPRRAEFVDRLRRYENSSDAQP